MMTLVRHGVLLALVAAAVAACSSPSPHEQAVTNEIAQLTPLKTTYSGVVMGFDVRDDTTLLVSLDLQSYIGMDDDAAEAMRRAIVQHWAAAWSTAHSGAHATLHVRFIDFIGRKIAEKTVRA